MVRKPYQCPYCSQTCPRKWNLKIHINRRHKGRENPFETSSGAQFDSTKFTPFNTDRVRWNNNHLHFSQGYHNQNNQWAFTTNNNYYPFKEDFNLTDSSSKNSDSMQVLQEELHQAIEIKKMVNQMWPTINQSFASAFMPLLITVMLFRDTSYPSTFLALNSLLKIGKENKNLGFRGRICYNCPACWVDPVYNNEGEMKSLLYIKPRLHWCDSEKVAGAQEIQDVQIKKSELENQLIPLLLSLSYMCARSGKLYLETEELTYSPDYAMKVLLNQSSNYTEEANNSMKQEPYLRNWIEGEEVNCNRVDIALPLVEQKHWAYRAISGAAKFGKSSIEIDNLELIDFITVAKGTFGVLTTDIGESICHFLMYISFRDDARGDTVEK
jgi:hypothetical protein